jgi:hypothetical protein
MSIRYWATLHSRALTDCAIPRRCPLRCSVKAETAAAGSYVYCTLAHRSGQKTTVGRLP